MPTIRSTTSMDGSGPWGPCVVCERPSDIWAQTPGRPDLRTVPIHITCQMFVIGAYRRLRNGHVLSAGTALRFAEYQRRLIAAQT